MEGEVGRLAACAAVGGGLRAPRPLPIPPLPPSHSPSAPLNGPSGRVTGGSCQEADVDWEEGVKSWG